MKEKMHEMGEIMDGTVRVKELSFSLRVSDPTGRDALPLASANMEGAGFKSHARQLRPVGSDRYKPSVDGTLK